MRQIDQRRIAAQVALANRITKHGEIDMEQALREREALAARVDGKRAYFLAWMRKQGWPQYRIDSELRRIDELIVSLRTPPFSRQALGGLGGMLGLAKSGINWNGCRSRTPSARAFRTRS